MISGLPSKLMARAARMLRDPPHRLIHEAAATLSPLNSAGYPGVFGLLQNDLGHVRCHHYATSFKQVDRDCVHAFVTIYLVPQ